MAKNNELEIAKFYKNFSTILTEYLEVESTVTNEFGVQETHTEQEWIAISLIKEAKKGNLKAIAMIMDRMDGRVANVTQLKIPFEDEEKIVLPLLVIRTQ